MSAFSSSFQQQQQQQHPFILDSTLLFLPNNDPFINAYDPFSIQILPHQDLTLTTMDDDVTHKRKSQQEKKGKKPLQKMKKNCDDEKKDYIHVRARRGQATDSHSLAERARREKISERMKLLQALVPGCEKVTGKAPVLDEIINYIQSLQYQTEFLSMRLASLSPTCYDFGAGLESFMVRPDRDLSNLPSMEAACSPTTAIDNYRGLLDDSGSSLLLPRAQMPDVFFPLI